MKVIVPNSLTNMKEHIKELALNHAIEVLGQEEFENNPDAVEAISFDFKSGIEAVLAHPQEFGLQLVH